MKAPLLDLRPQLKSIEAELKAAVNEVIDSTRYVLGPKVDALEESVAALTGVRAAIGVSSGTDALLIALMALDIGPGDIVLTTPYSFFATAGVIARLGARPAFVDIERDTYNIDSSALARWFDEHASEAAKVKAIIPVHLYGQCADMDPILEIGRSRSIPIVEDAAQAIGAQYPSTAGLRRAGAMGAMGCFSFFPTKNLGALGDGGMVVTDDEALGAKLKKLRVHGSAPKYFHALIGGNFRIDPIQAAALSVKLPHLEEWSAGRREKARVYDEAFGGGPIQTPHIAYERDHHIYNQYVIAVPGERDEFRSYLTENEIGSEIYYPVPFHEQECFQYLGYKVGDFPNSEWAARQTVALPVYPEMPDETQQYVIEKIGAYFD